MTNQPPTSTDQPPPTDIPAAVPIRRGRWVFITTVAYNSLYSFTVKDCFSMAAALAYFAVLSAVPLLVVLLSLLPRLIGLVSPNFDLDVALIDFIYRTFVPEVASWVSGILPVVRDQLGLLGGVGVLLLIWSASNVFRQLDVSIWTIWDAYADLGETTIRQAVRNFLHGRLRSLLLILVIAALFLGDQLASLALFLAQRELLTLSGERWGGPLVTWTSFLISLVLGVLSMAVLYRYLPPRRVPWRFVWPGAIIAGLLNKALGTVVSLTISGLFAGVYQAVGGPVALLLWAYTVGQSILLGCVITRQHWLLVQEMEGDFDKVIR